MAGDLHYKLVVDMSSTGSLAPHLEKASKAGGDLSGHFAKVKDAVGGIASSLASGFTGAVESAASLAATVGKVGAAGAVAAVGLGVKLNSELEQAQVSLASIFSAEGMSNGMLNGMKDAQSVMKDMRKDAADLPGEFKDLVGIFRMAATPGFQAGASIKQLEKISANSMASAAGMGIQMDQAARELGQLLGGHAGGHNVFGSLLGFTGDKAQTFNKSSAKERLASVEKELAKREESRSFFGNTFDAMSSTFIDNGKKFLGAATGGVFDRIKGALDKANTWFDANETRVIGFAEKVGDKLSYAFEVGQRKIEEWSPAVVSFADNAYHRLSSIWERVGPVLERVGESLKKALADPALFDRVEGVLRLYAAVKIGGMLAPAAGSLMGGVGELAGASSAAGAAGAAGGLAASAAAGAALVVLGTTVYGVVDVLTDSQNRYHEFASKQASELTGHAEHINNALGPSGFTGAFKSVADFMGTAGLTVANNWAYTADLFTSGLSALTGAVNGAGAAFNSFIGIANKLKDDPADARGQYEGPDVSDPIFSLKRLGGDGGLGAAQEANKKHAGVHGGGGTSIQKVEIVVSSNQDPSRIARAVKDEMMNVSRNPTSSRHVRNWGAVRP